MRVVRRPYGFYPEHPSFGLDMAQARWLRSRTLVVQAHCLSCGWSSSPVHELARPGRMARDWKRVAIGIFILQSQHAQCPRSKQPGFRIEPRWLLPLLAEFYRGDRN